MGQTLVKPRAQVIEGLCIGQLQLQSHCPLPSGQSHLQEHCIPSPVGGIGVDPDPEPAGGMEPEPDPVGGMEPDPDPVGGMEPDPEPVGGMEPDPEPVGGMEPEPDPVGGAIVISAASNFPFDSLTVPFVTFMLKVNSPESPDILTDLAAPEHFLSHFPADAEVILVPAPYRVKLQVQVFLPTFTFWFLKTS